MVIWIAADMTNVLAWSFAMLWSLPFVACCTLRFKCAWQTPPCHPTLTHAAGPACGFAAAVAVSNAAYAIVNGLSVHVVMPRDQQRYLGLCLS